MTRNQQHAEFGRQLRKQHAKRQLDADAINAAITAYLVTFYPNYRRSTRIDNMMRDAKLTINAGYYKERDNHGRTT